MCTGLGPPVEELSPSMGNLASLACVCPLSEDLMGLELTRKGGQNPSEWETNSNLCSPLACHVGTCYLGTYYATLHF